MKGRKPDPQSLQGRMRAFYEQNPNEWLTFSDAKNQFNATERQIRSAFDKVRVDLGLRLITVIGRSEGPT